MIGDNLRWFVGTVLSTNDPYEKGRVQVRINGVHSGNPSDINRDQFPWAHVVLPSTEGGVSGIGKIPQIVESAFVFGFFLDGARSQVPIVIGSMTHDEGPTSDQIAAAKNAFERGDFIPGNTGPGGTVMPEDVRLNWSDDPAAINKRRLLIMKFLMAQYDENGQARFTAEQAAGIVGNLERENSTFDPGVKGDVNIGGSYGLAQWNVRAGRFGNLQKFAESLPGGRDWREFDVQLLFLMHELVGKGKATGGGTHNYVYNALRKATNFYGYPNRDSKGTARYDKVNATWIFLDKYENPADKRGKIKISERYAIKAFEQYQAMVINAKVRGAR